MPDPLHPENTRGFFEPAKLREWIKEDTKKAFEAALNKIESDQFHLKVSNLEYSRKTPFSLKEQKQALMEKRDIALPLHGTVDLVEKKTGKVLESKKVLLANVPYITDRNTSLLNGSEYIGQCFHGDSFVWTDQGMLYIKDIVNKRLNVKVWSYNFETKQLELKPIVNWFKNKSLSDLVCVNFHAPARFSIEHNRFSPSTVWATPTHKFYNLAGLTEEARNLTKSVIVYEELSYVQKQLVYGTFLGDVHIDQRGLYKATHSNVQEEYLILKASILGNLVSNKGVYAGTPYLCKSTEIHWPVKFDSKAHYLFWELRKKYYDRALNKIKSLDLKLLSQIDELGLAFLYFDDGCIQYTRDTNYPILTLCLNWFTEEELKLIQTWLLSRWKLNSYISKAKTIFSSRPRNKNRNFTLKLAGDNAKNFLRLVAPYAIPCLYYKFLPRPVTGHCKFCNCETDRQTTICGACYVKKAKTDIPWFTKYSNGKRFGGRKFARQVDVKGLIEPNPAAWWDEVQKLLGTKVDLLFDRKPLSYALSEISCSIDQTGEKRFAKHRTVYDIEVQDNHNYFINGVLVSNCQQRLKPGVYSRIKESGEAEAHINVLPGTGFGGKIIFYPEKAQFVYMVGSTQIKLYGLLKDLGVSDGSMRSAWGEEIFNRNRADYTGTEIEKLHDKIFNR